MRTDDFIYVAEGSRIILKDKAYQYAYALFTLKRPKEYIYTYAYQAEENWCTCEGKYSSDGFLTEDTVFSGENLPPEKEGYIRLSVRKLSGAGDEKADSLEESTIPEWTEEVLEVTGVKEEEALAEKEAAFLDRKDVKDEIERVARTVQKKRTEACLVFTLLTDTHYVVNGNWETCAAAIEAVNYRVRPDGVIHLGDLTDGILDKRICREYSHKVIDRILGWKIPFYMAIGNHDVNYFKRNQYILSKEEQFDYYLRDIVSGDLEEGQLWYKADFPIQKLRFLFLHSYDNREKQRYGFPSEELEWVERQLKELKDDWRVILFSHDAPLARLDYWAAEIRNGEALTVLLDTWNKAHEHRILALIHGHTHADYVYRGRTFPIISVGSSKIEYFEDKKPDGAIAPVRIEGEVSQELWDTVIINGESGRLDFVRFGAGIDRTVTNVQANDRVYAEENKPKIWAHRGASGYAPENTLEAFALAEKLGADGVELDVQYTKDRQLVVIHDERIDRVSDGQGSVAEYTLEDLRRFNFNRTHPKYVHADIPTLREVLELLKPTKLTVNIELKTGINFYPGIEQEALRQVHELGIEKRVIYSSFNHASIMKIRELDPDAKTGFLYSDGTLDMPVYAAERGVNALHPACYNVKYPGFVKMCREKGIRLHVWTVNDRIEMERMAQLGVDAVITNYPDLAYEVMYGERIPVPEPPQGERSIEEAVVDSENVEAAPKRKKGGVLHLAGVTYSKVRKVFVVIDEVVQKMAGR